MEYNLLHVLGDGGEARVHLAVCVQSGTYCAIKIPHVPWHPLSRELLAREAIRRIQVQGPRVVNVLDWGFDGSTPFIAIEFADQGTLQHEFDDFRARNEVYHPRTALMRIREILLALADIHDRNVIHRDVKPENICFFSNGDVALNGFGIGRTLTRPYDLQTRGFVGTQVYASPEQKLQLPVDHRADLYSAGVILYEMAVSNLNRNWERCDSRRRPHREFENRGTRVGVR